MVISQSLCPCRSKKQYANCCEAYLTGTAVAPTAEALMRSRYTAYCKSNVDYLIATLHPKSRKKNDRATMAQSMQNTRWIGLKIVKTQKGQIQDRRGVVEFVAQYQPVQSNGLPMMGVVNQLHERSRFIKAGGQWFYVDGDILLPLQGLQ
jgi:SEC-C motif domain protein